jgi:putative inorganic carbon (hco3(-)) transporter
MLRLGLVLSLIAVGIYYALQSPFYALLFYVGNAYFRPEDWVWHDFVGSLKLSLVIGIYVLIFSVFSRHRFIWDGRIALLWAFLGFSTLSAALSDYAVLSVPYLLDFLKVIVITYLIIVLVTDFAKFRLVVLVMVLSLGILQAKQGWFYLLTSPGWPNYNPVPFLGDNNGTALGMLMLVPLIGMLRQTTENRWAKYFFGMMLIGCLYRALSTYSRGGFLAAIAMGGVWWLRSYRKLQGLVVMLLMLAIIVPMLPSTFWNRMSTIQTYEEEQDKSALARLHYWSTAIDMAAANPILGVGFRTYNDAYNAYDSSGGAYGPWRAVHNSFLGVLAEVGYIGFFLYVAIILAAFRACAQVRKLAIRNAVLPDLGRAAIALEASVVAFVVGANFLTFHYNEMIWHIIGLSTVLRRLAIQQTEHLSSRAQPLTPQPGAFRDPAAA